MKLNRETQQFESDRLPLWKALIRFGGALLWFIALVAAVGGDFTVAVPLFALGVVFVVIGDPMVALPLVMLWLVVTVSVVRKYRSIRNRLRETHG